MRNFHFFEGRGRNGEKHLCVISNRLSFQPPSRQKGRKGGGKEKKGGRKIEGKGRGGEKRGEGVGWTQMRIDGRRKEVEGKARKWEEEGEGKKVKEGGGKRPPSSSCAMEGGNEGEGSCK